MSLYCDACKNETTPQFLSVIDPQTLETFQIERCTVCQLGHTVPVPQNLSPYYGSAYHGGRHGLTASYCVARRINLLTQTMGMTRRRQLLDIGCGDGSFLLKAKRKGWDVVGTELNPTLARAAGIEVYDSIEMIPAEQRFDCITLWHSLEHLPHPSTTLTRLAAMLSSQGTLLIAVPDAGGLQASVFGARWFHLDVPRHLYHFNKRALSHLLEKTGFQPERFWHQEFEYDLFGWAQSALNMIIPQPNVFFYQLTGKKIDATPVYMILSFLLGVFFLTLSLPVLVISALLRRGGTLIVAARRRDILPEQ